MGADGTELPRYTRRWKTWVACILTACLLAPTPATGQNESDVAEEVTTFIDLGASYTDFAFDVEGERLVVALLGFGIQVVDLASREVEARIPFDRDVLSIALSGDGQTVYAFLQSGLGVMPRTAALAEVDVDTGTVRSIRDVTDVVPGWISDMMVVSGSLLMSFADGDGDAVWVVDLDAQTAPVRLADSQAYGTSVTFADTEDPDVLYLLGRVPDGDWEGGRVTAIDATDPSFPTLRQADITQEVDFGTFVVGSPDGSRLYSYGSASIDTSTLEVAEEFTPGGKSVSADDRYLYSVFGQGGSVAAARRYDLTQPSLPVDMILDCPASDGPAARVLDDEVLVTVFLASVCISPVPQTPAAGLTDLDTSTTERIDLADPTEFAARVSQLRFPDGTLQPAEHAVLSRSDVFADSLSGASLTLRAPLLYTDRDVLSEVTLSELDRVLDPGDTVYLLGGSDAISGSVEQAVQSAGFRTNRLGGADRIATSIEVAQEINDRALGSREVPGDIYLARADAPETSSTAAWADSIAVGRNSARYGVPVLLTPTGELDDRVRAFVEHGPGRVVRAVVLGGPAALSPSVLESLEGIEELSAVRVAGDNRAGTAVRVALDLDEVSVDADRRLVAFNGYAEDGWAYGVVGAGIAAQLDADLVMVGEVVPPETASFVDCAAEVEILVLGGEDAVSEDVARDLTGVSDGCTP